MTKILYKSDEILSENDGRPPVEVVGIEVLKKERYNVEGGVRKADYYTIKLSDIKHFYDDASKRKVRDGWKKGDYVEVFSESKRHWFKGQIVDVDGKRLYLTYNTGTRSSHTKSCYRYDEEVIRPISEGHPSKLECIRAHD